MSMHAAFALYMIAVVLFAFALHRAPSWTIRPRAGRPLTAVAIVAVWAAAAAIGYGIPELIHQNHMTNLAPYTGLGIMGRLAQVVGIGALVYAAVDKTPLFAFVAGFGAVAWAVLSWLH